MFSISMLQNALEDAWGDGENVGTEKELRELREFCDRAIKTQRKEKFEQLVENVIKALAELRHEFPKSYDYDAPCDGEWTKENFWECMENFMSPEYWESGENFDWEAKKEG